MSDATTPEADATDHVDPLITETASRLFGEMCTHDAVQAAEASGECPDVWHAFAETGFPWVSIPAEKGGSGGSLFDALEILRIAGAHSAPIPVAETGLLGGWLLANASLEIPGGIVTVASDPRNSLTLDDSGTVSGCAHAVPWGRMAERVVALIDGQVVSIPGDAASVTTQRGLSGEPRDELRFDRTPADLAPAPAGTDQHQLRLRGALSRVALMAGALDRMSRLTVSYTNDRHQFGRPVARFQAVQTHLVWAAQDAALAGVAATAAARAAARGDAEFEIAAAKINCNQAATRATKACHQAHGAMGMTQEYPLHHLSRRLWTWRSEYGGTREWTSIVGARAVAGGPDALYPLITGGSTVEHSTIAATTG